MAVRQRRATADVACRVSEYRARREAGEHLARLLEGIESHSGQVKKRRPTDREVFAYFNDDWKGLEPANAWLPVSLLGS